MARKLRIEFAGACYHVINRGNYRRQLFTGKGAAEAFERCLAEAAERFGWQVHAYVVMSNHFHLAVKTPEPNLSEAMKWWQGTWAARINRFRGETGRPIQGRYKALHVEPGESFRAGRALRPFEPRARRHCAAGAPARVPAQQPAPVSGPRSAGVAHCGYGPHRERPR